MVHTLISLVGKNDRGTTVAGQEGSSLHVSDVGSAPAAAHRASSCAAAAAAAPPEAGAAVPPPRRHAHHSAARRQALGLRSSSRTCRTVYDRCPGASHWQGPLRQGGRGRGVGTVRYL